jgi:hypothetical protein
LQYATGRLLLLVLLLVLLLLLVELSRCRHAG